MSAAVQQPLARALGARNDTKSGMTLPSAIENGNPAQARPPASGPDLTRAAAPGPRDT
jgi:hypothetical protein